MGTGPNFVLDKGFYANGTTAYAVGEAVTIDTAVQSMKRIGAAATAADRVMVCMEACDASKLTANPGKVVLRARMSGIARALVGTGGFAKGARLTTNASSQFVAQATAGGPVVAVALEAGTAGGYAEIELTPGATL